MEKTTIRIKAFGFNKLSTDQLRKATVGQDYFNCHFNIDCEDCPFNFDSPCNGHRTQEKAMYKLAKAELGRRLKNED